MHQNLIVYIITLLLTLSVTLTLKEVRSGFKLKGGACNFFYFIFLNGSRYKWLTFLGESGCSSFIQ